MLAQYMGESSSEPPRNLLVKGVKSDPSLHTIWRKPLAKWTD
jgi:hypothetical protein